MPTACQPSSLLFQSVDSFLNPSTTMWGSCEAGASCNADGFLCAYSWSVLITGGCPSLYFQTHQLKTVGIYINRAHHESINIVFEGERSALSTSGFTIIILQFMLISKDRKQDLMYLKNLYRVIILSVSVSAVIKYAQVFKIEIKIWKRSSYLQSN